MSEVKEVTAILSNPTGRDEVGQITYGFYTIEGQKLTMTDGEGTPVRRKNGDLVQHTLGEGENPDDVARRLTKDFRRHIHGDSPDFNRPLSYPKRGWR
jgi:hypothetical protein